jgi:hypothetical protein
VNTPESSICFPLIKAGDYMVIWGQYYPGASLCERAHQQLKPMLIIANSIGFFNLPAHDKATAPHA